MDMKVSHAIRSNMQLKLEVEKRDNGDVTQLGEWDLTIQALLAIRDGQIACWLDGRIVPSTQSNLHMPHVLRECAWQGTLFVSKKDPRLPAFVTQARRHGETSDILEILEMLSDIKQMKADTENLLHIIKRAKVETNSPTTLCNPLTGEISDTMDVAIPFAFGTQQKIWKGPTVEEVKDVFAERDLQPHHFIRSLLPENDLNKLDASSLERIITHFIEENAEEDLSSNLKLWNEKNKLIQIVPNYERIFLSEQLESKKDVTQWVETYLCLLDTMEANLKEKISKI